ncbi:MAG: hypothetical protein V3S81_00035, partial [Anaerolineales bacterium]
RKIRYADRLPPLDGEEERVIAMKGTDLTFRARVEWFIVHAALPQQRKGFQAGIRSCFGESELIDIGSLVDGI